MDNTLIIHISGNKENSGKILKVNQSLVKTFGYNKNEVIGHTINILMPELYGKRHNEFLNRYFRTGYKTVFNKERNFYALQRNGFCIYIKLLVKQLPTFDEGIQYVGMILHEENEYDYILTDEDRKSVV